MLESLIMVKDTELEFYEAEGLRVESEPFVHVKVAPVLRAEEAEEFLGILERMDWQRRKQSFYEFDVVTNQHSQEYFKGRLVRSRTIDRVREWLEQCLSSRLVPDAIVDLYRYSPGTGVGVHTDRPTAEARFVLNLNRSWQPDQGGIWVLSSHSDLKPPVHFLPPLHNTGFGFLTNAVSYHALSERLCSDTYAVVFRFAVREIKD